MDCKGRQGYGPCLRLATAPASRPPRTGEGREKPGHPLPSQGRGTGGYIKSHGILIVWLPQGAAHMGRNSPDWILEALGSLFSEHQAVISLQVLSRSRQKRA